MSGRNGYFRKWRGLVLGTFLLLAPIVSYGTHLRAGEIIVERLNCTSLTFRITITVYTNTGSDIKFGDGILDFGDKSEPEITPQIDNTRRPDLGPNVGTVSYSTEHTYSGPGRFVISYLEANRNGGILNVFNSVETKFYLETVINIDPFLGCNNTPKLLVPPIDKACTSAAWYHNPGAYDPDGDSLSFEFTVPKRDKGQVVDNYRDPDNREFYNIPGLDYTLANEDGDGPPTFTIDSRTGTIVWDAPGSAGEYNIAFLIIEWRKIAGVWVKMGYVVRDMQIIVEDCSNQRPELDTPQDICVEAGDEVIQDIFGWDPDSDSVKIEAFSQVFEINPNPATTIPSPFKFLPSSPVNKARLIFKWQTDCEHVKDQPYQVVFKITDKPKQGPRLVQFITWNIKVVGPAPTWENAQINLANRSATVKWESYPCTNASVMQVWRRVDQFAFTPPECVTGMPEFLGFEKIKELPINAVQFVDTNNDKGLAVGAQYCYRLVAVFPLPGGGESYVSQDICLDPILADAPVITNVSVDKTARTDGQVRVRWRSPFDLNKTQFPPPYKYEVYRAEGFSGNIKLTTNPIHPGKLTDSTYLDTNINTEETIYNYRIVLYDGNNTKVDTSSTASTVRLETKPQVKKIELTWNADVPWSNQTQSYPRHLIYRGSANATESQLTLIDSVDVGQYKFIYVDSGQYQSTPLKETETYCYRIQTRGAYGNPKIEEPLKNFSQIMCAQPNDAEAPCKPELSITGLDCAEIIKTTACGINVFSNTLMWKRPSDEACRADIRSYNIYIANKIGDDFTLYVENVRDTFFIDSNENLKSYARCYKISAVDRSGNESDLSEEYCFDNCPYYEMPNVFTPNGDDCNEKFSAYNDRAQVDEQGEGPCGPINLSNVRERCARFVDRVDFTVYNRWGKEVYSFVGIKGDDLHTVYVDWDGRDNNGQALATGIYYYIADVTFDVVDPSQQNRTIKGWVHLLR
jgi:CHU_C Type IX secretion signal domain